MNQLNLSISIITFITVIFGVLHNMMSNKQQMKDLKDWSKENIGDIKKNLSEHMAEDGKTHNSLHRRIDLIEREGCARGKDRH